MKCFEQTKSISKKKIFPIVKTAMSIGYEMESGNPNEDELHSMLVDLLEEIRKIQSEFPIKEGYRFFQQGENTK